MFPFFFCIFPTKIRSQKRSKFYVVRAGHIATNEGLCTHTHTSQFKPPLQQKKKRNITYFGTCLVLYLKKIWIILDIKNLNCISKIVSIWVPNHWATNDLICNPSLGHKISFWRLTQRELRDKCSPVNCSRRLLSP